MLKLITAHISLAEVSHMTTSNLKWARKSNLTMSRMREGQQIYQ